jgi:hypothetical protein
MGGALEMEPPQSVARRYGVVVLDKSLGNSGLRKLACLEGFHERTAIVAEEAGLDDEEAREGTAMENKGHCTYSFAEFRDEKRNKTMLKKKGPVPSCNSSLVRAIRLEC